MKICPKAPQAAKANIVGAIEGLRSMNARASESSERPFLFAERGVAGRRGDRIRYEDEMAVDKTF